MKTLKELYALMICRHKANLRAQKLEAYLNGSVHGCLGGYYAAENENHEQQAILQWTIAGTCRGMEAATPPAVGFGYDM
ncbi:unnamed protein product [Nippostrongylus brasiliensis]|uniref:SCP domain-containing protein n=1 Tax=Nippostrongylus brasiliensis TaxID=27835 RepID=A0A0N4XWM7_NIPBR|nr:unnamed protein product [Nippostrongylus brasiliensis]